MRGKGQLFRTILRASVAGLAGVAAIAPSAGEAQGNLLIAPTRLVLDGRRGDEVILANTGSEEETYRVSLELRRMDADGNLVPVAEDQASDAEKAALAMVRYAPRRVTLPPSQPQSIRISARPGADLPVLPGAWLDHLLHRHVLPDMLRDDAVLGQDREGKGSVRLVQGEGDGLVIDRLDP